MISGADFSFLGLFSLTRLTPGSSVKNKNKKALNTFHNQMVIMPISFYILFFTSFFLLNFIASSTQTPGHMWQKEDSHIWLNEAFWRCKTWIVSAVFHRWSRSVFILNFF